MNPLERRVAILEAQLAAALRRLEQMPMRAGGGRGSSSGIQSYLVRISGGNTLYTGLAGTVTGINNSGTVITSVPTTAPGAASYTNGIGGGQLINPDGTLGASVWVVNQPINPGSGVLIPGISVPLPSLVSVTCLQFGSIPVAAGGTTTIYLPVCA
jgi:hypothetical protein